jgi:serine/threonine protein kinase/tetratricopeptide (TPR) repeat protein
MTNPIPPNTTATDPRLQQAILDYLKAEDAGTPIDAEQWLLRFPADMRPTLRDFLSRHLSPSGRARPAPGPALAPFDKYSDFQLLASGGMGSIYRCTDTHLRRPLAMKVMHPHLTTQHELVMRFLEEARTSARMQHPAVAPVHEMGQMPNGQPFFTMKLIEGRTLGEAIKDCLRKPSWSRLETLLRQFAIVCDAVEHAHSRGILHRDLKSANIMVGAFNEVLVLDWGLAKSMAARQQRGPGPSPACYFGGGDNETEGPHLTQPGLIRGTLAYMPPEQADSSCPALDEACDVFALGSILCQILTGFPPYASDKANATERQLDLLAQARACRTEAAFARLQEVHAPKPLVDLIRKCLAPKPADRPRRAKEVGQAVLDYLRSVRDSKRREEVQKAEKTVAVTEGRKRRRVMLVLGSLLAGSLIVALAIVGGYEWRQWAQHRLQITDLTKLLTETESLIEQNKQIEAREVLSRAQGRAAEGAPPDLRSRLDTADQTIKLLGELRHCRESSWQMTQAGPNLGGAAREYEAVFRKYGYDPEQGPTFADRARRAHAQSAIANALDHWAYCTEGRIRLLELAETVEPGRDGWSAYRDRSNWLDAAGVERIIKATEKGLTGPRCALLAMLLRERKNNCLGQLEKFRADFPKEYEIALEIGHYHLLHGVGEGKREALTKAAGAYQTATAIYPESAAAWSNMGLALQRVGDHAGADNAFRAGNKAQPDNIYCHCMFACHLYGSSRWTDAWKEYEAARTLQDGHPYVCLVGALLNTENGRQDEADKRVRVALKEMPDQAMVYLIRGLISARQGKWDEAIAAFDKARKMPSSDSLMQAFDRVLPVYETVVINEMMRGADNRLPRVMKGELKPKSEADRCNLGEVAFIRGEPAFAAQLFQEGFNPAKTTDFERGGSWLFFVHHTTVAARAALLAAERDTSADEQRKYRKYALDWLTADLKQLEVLTKKAGDPPKPDFAKLLLESVGMKPEMMGENYLQLEPRRHVEAWQMYAEFQTVRDPSKLSQLPQQEQEAWQALWARADRLCPKK